MSGIGYGSLPVHLDGASSPAANGAYRYRGAFWGTRTIEHNTILAGWALALLIGLPLLSHRDSRPVEARGGEAGFRRAIYVSIAISLSLVAGLTLAVATWQRVDAGRLGWRVGSVPEALAWSLGTGAAGLAGLGLVTWGAHRMRLKEGRLAFLLMPRDAGEKRMFVVLAVLGAVCEEYVYRGFLLRMVTEWVASPGWAIVVTALSFGLAHGYQRAVGIVRAALLGALLAVPVVWTGSLFPAVAAHFWINAAIGLGGWKLLAREQEETG
ncbi:MAG: lysostaphin resistance A-like protein [Gemmatimonadota bacterium]